MAKHAKELECTAYVLKMDLYRELAADLNSILDREKTVALDGGPKTTFSREMIIWHGARRDDFHLLQRRFWGSLRKVECDTVPQGMLFLVRFAGKWIHRSVGRDLVLPVLAAGCEIYEHDPQPRSYSQELAMRNSESSVDTYFWSGDIAAVAREYERFVQLEASGVRHAEIVRIVKAESRNWKKTPSSD